MSLSPAVIDAMVANGATVEMLAAVMKAELAAIASERADAEALAAARRAAAAEKKRRQRAERPEMPLGRPEMSRDVPGTHGDIAGHAGTPPETKVSPTPPSKTQTLVIPPIVPQKVDASLFDGAEIEIAAGGKLADLLDGEASPKAKRKQAKALRLASDVEFSRLWNVATPLMRRRGKSQDVVYDAWDAAKKRQLPEMIIAALQRYVTEDEDVQRGMGQPGLQRWLADKVYDQWLPTEAPAAMPNETIDFSGWSDERWTATVNTWRRTGHWPPDYGPPPDDPDTHAPERFRYPQTRTAA